MKELRLRIAQEADLAVVVTRIAHALRTAKAPEEETIRVLTVVMELSRNIMKYAGEGELRFGCQPRDGRIACWVEAEDNGPGIADVQLAMADHFSTGNSLGLGLPGVKRLMDRMEVQSSIGTGTRVRAERTFDA